VVGYSITKIKQPQNKQIIDLPSLMEAVEAEVKKYPKRFFLNKKIHPLKDGNGYYIL